MMRCTLPKESAVSYSTIIREERSHRLQITALLPVISPLATPYGMLGRIRSEVIIAGAEDCANPDFDRRFAAIIPLPAIAEPSRKWRRLGGLGFFSLEI